MERLLAAAEREERRASSNSSWWRWGTNWVVTFGFAAGTVGIIRKWDHDGLAGNTGMLLKASTVTKHAYPVAVPGRRRYVESSE